MRQPAAPPQPVHSDSSFPAIGAPIEVRRHPKARRLTLRVSRTRRAVIVTLPVQCDLDEAGSFVHRNIDWVRERLGSLPHPVHFADGMVLPLRAVAHRLSFQGPATGRGLVEAFSPPGGAAELRVFGHAEHAPRRLKDWLWEEARRDLDARVSWHAAVLGRRPKRIVVRDQTSRWGSCSTTGVLSFSWRLVLAPPRVLDYVAAHEVAHLAEMNHGPRFWALVRSTVPCMDEARRWLQVYGADLHRYGPARDG
jgi:predicted metal-dependent hydrolase